MGYDSKKKKKKRKFTWVIFSKIKNKKITWGRILFTI